MVKRTVCKYIGDLCQKVEKSVVQFELLGEFSNFIKDE